MRTPADVELVILSTHFDDIVLNSTEFQGRTIFAEDSVDSS